MTPQASPVSPARRALYYASFILAMAVGGLQMYHVRGGWITNYGADLFGPAWLYWMKRGTVPGRIYRRWFGPNRPRPAPTAAVIFFLCLAWEVSQLFEWTGTPLAITRGRFDPWDIASYAVSLVLCYLIDLRLGTESRSYFESSPSRRE